MGSAVELATEAVVRLPKGAWIVVKEVARHLLRRPVIGIAALATAPDGRRVLIRRRDTGEWALPGGTLEWGETLRAAITRELAEEAGVEVRELGELLGIYSDPGRDPRFHAVTVVVGVAVTDPIRAPLNPAEIVEVGLFLDAELPQSLSHGMDPMLRHALRGAVGWE